MKIYLFTSNRHVHAMQPMAYLFNKYWDQTQLVTVLCYENQPTNLPDNFEVISIGKQADYTWSGGILHWLQGVDDEIFIFLLEDYFLKSAVDLTAVRALYQYMLDNKEVAKIGLAGHRTRWPHTDYAMMAGTQIIKSADDALFQTTTQPAIWRRDFMMKFLEPSEDGWQFERKGGKRVIAAKRQGWKGDVLGVKIPLVDYVNAIGSGEATVKPSWSHKRIPIWVWAELQNKKLVGEK